ncbi:389_t:CDS:2, partial [Acaulospora colombiana]
MSAEASSTTSDTIAIVQTFTSQSAVVADVISPFLPLVAEIVNMVNEIVQIYQTAEHNKRICGSLMSRATAAENSVNLLTIRRSENEDLFRSKEFYMNFRKLVTVIEKIKMFIEEVSQIKGLRRFLSARSIEDEFQDLTEEFDGMMRILNFTMAVKNQIQAEEDKEILNSDIREMKKYLERIEGGIANSMAEINASLDDITKLNIAWQKKLFNDDRNVLESATIKMSELQDPLEQIKRGSKVFKKIRMGEDVAIKEKILTNNNENLVNDITSQVVILKKLKESQCILQFYGVARDANAIYMVSEWCEYGNLREFYREYGPLEWHIKSQLAVDIARGLTFLHAVSILHHDIRPDNQPPFPDERDILEIRKKILELKIRPSFSANVPPEWSKTSYQAMQDSPEARPALKDMFMSLYSFYQKCQPQSPRLNSLTRMPTEDDLPEVDDNLALDDLSLNVMSLKEAIAEHKKKGGDKLMAWRAFKVHAEEFGDITARYWMGYYLYYDLCPIDDPEDKEARKKRLEQAAATVGLIAHTSLQAHKP